MTEHSSGPDPGGVRFEPRDVEAGSIARFGIVLAVVTLAVSVLLVFMLRFLKRLEVEGDPPPAPMARMEAGRQPPEPRLQRMPFDDIEALKAAEDARLRSYGWVDEKAGIVHIPIQAAMETLLKQGLPARATPAEPKR